MKRKRSVLFNIVTNLVLAFLIFSVGLVCFVPVDSEAGATDEEGLYRSAGDTSDGVSLMLNVYWGTEEVYQILDTLDEYSAKVTFFIGGSWADDNVECLKEIVNRGHELGNHGYFHKDHDKLSYADNKNEIVRCNQFVALATGVTPTLFAPPSGAYDEATLSVCKALQMKVILWTRDTIDWRDKDASLTYTRATKNIRGGEFVLMHPMPATAAALPNILKYYASQNLRCVTVSENLRLGG